MRRAELARPLRKSAMSTAVTDPYSCSVSPTRRAMVMSIVDNRDAIASACDFSSASRVSMIFRSRSTCFLFPSVAGNASFRGNR